MNEHDEKVINDFVKFLLSCMPAQYGIVKAMLLSKAKQYIEKDGK